MSAAPLGRAWLAGHLPHRDGMSLLDEVVAWDATTIRAVARRHRSPEHPLRRDGILPIAAGIEYGAQAAAAHGALCAGRPSAAGMLASARSVVFHGARLDDIPGDLDVVAEQVGAGPGGVIYRFGIFSAGRALVEGRIAVAFAP